MAITKRYDDFTVGRPGFWTVILITTLLTMGIREASNTALFVLFALIVTQFVITAARCRDAGLNGWWCLTLLLPYIALIYFGCIRPDDHPKKLQAFEKLRVHDAPEAPEAGHTLIDIPHSKE